MDCVIVFFHGYLHILRCILKYSTEAPNNPRQQREMMAELMFEYFETPALYVGLQTPMALYASGRTSGLVVDSGDGVTVTAAVVEVNSLTKIAIYVFLLCTVLFQFLELELLSVFFIRSYRAMC